MNKIRVQWDDRKNRLNQKKHGISFEEAETVFFDEDAVEFFDPDHSQNEDRFILIGMSFRLKVLVVCHCFRERDVFIRIISARKATHKERAYYERRKI